MADTDIFEQIEALKKGPAEFNEFSDDDTADALMAELESVVAEESEEPQATAGDRIREGIGNAFSNIAAIPSALSSLGERVGEGGPLMPFYDVPSAVLGAAKDAVVEAGPENVLRGVARTGAEVAGGVLPLAAGPLGAAASPSTAAIAGLGSDALIDYLTGAEGPEGGYKAEALRRVGEYNTMAGLGAATSKVKSVRPLKNRQIRNQNASIILSKQDPGGRMASELGFNRGGISQSNQAMAKRVSDDIVDAVDSGVLDGRKVDIATGKVVPDRPANTVMDALDNVRSVKADAIEQFNKSIDDLQVARDTYNATNPNSRLKGATLDEQDIANLNQAVERHKITPGASERVEMFKKEAQEMQRLIKETGAEVDIGSSGDWAGIVKEPTAELNLKQVTEALRGINEQRRLNGKYELAMDVASGRGDAALLAKARAQNEFLDALYPILQKKQSELIADTLRVAPTVADQIGTDAMRRLVKITPDSMSKMNSLYGKMSTAEIALERAQAQVNSFANTAAPNSLITAVQGRGPKAGALSKLVEHSSERAAEMGVLPNVDLDALKYSQGVVQRLRDTAKMSKMSPTPETSMFANRSPQQLATAGQVAIQAAKLPRSVENFFALPSDMIPPEILEDEESRQLIEEAQNSTDDVRGSALNKIVGKHRFLFEDEPVRGFDMVQDSDGQYRIHDPLKQRSYGDYLRKTVKNRLELAEKLAALNRDGTVIGVQRPMPKPTIEPPPANSTQYIDGQATSEYKF